jgi:hypothetical protein
MHTFSRSLLFAAAVVAVAVASTGVVALPLSAQGAAAAKCAAGPFRQFDFWVGEWTVSDTANHVIAHSTIQRTAAGCAITEHWQPLQGADGASISWFAPSDSMWHQQWVGGGGWIARLKGSFRDGVMTMTETESSLPPSAGTNRMHWTRLPDGSVRQSLETTKDGGRTWVGSFVGIYRKSD